jgi:hypothetical protein
MSRLSVLAHSLSQSPDELQEWILQLLPWLRYVKMPFGTRLKLDRVQEKMFNTMHFVSYL